MAKSNFRCKSKRKHQFNKKECLITTDSNSTIDEEMARMSLELKDCKQRAQSLRDSNDKFWAELNQSVSNYFILIIPILCVIYVLVHA